MNDERTLEEQCYGECWAAKKQIADRDAEIERLKAENEALRRDAERYRWLRGETRKNPDFYSGETRWMVSCAQNGTARNLFGDRIDDAIDAELEKTK